MFKKILLIVSLMFFLFLNFSSINFFEEVKANVILGELTDVTGGLSDDIVVDNADGFTMLSVILKWVKDKLLAIISVIAIGVFLFTGIRLGMAKGNPEEFKKALMQFLYAIIGIFIVTVAWGTIKLVTTISL